MFPRLSLTILVGIVYLLVTLFTNVIVRFTFLYTVIHVVALALGLVALALSILLTERPATSILTVLYSALGIASSALVYADVPEIIPPSWLIFVPCLAEIAYMRMERRQRT